MRMNTESLSHAKWNYKYHWVFGRLLTSLVLRPELSWIGRTFFTTKCTKDTKNGIL
ncbi:MAG: hypothetical protein ACRC10_04735 [Thermoguttaceae bacterium]